MRDPRLSITCEWCHDPAWFVWQNNDPATLDDEPPMFDGLEPLELHTETAVCGRCQTLADEDPPELIDRALKMWCRAFGGVPSDPGWWENAHRTTAARLAAWLMYRAECYELYEDDEEIDHV